MSQPRKPNGKWVVIALVAAGILAALAGVKFRNLAERPDTTTTRPAPNNPK